MMARLMSVSHTLPQVEARTKTVTRRLGWRHARPGQEIRLVEKAMGLRKGEKVVDVARVRIVDVRIERLDEIELADVEAEGFPEWSVEDFIAFFRRNMRCAREAFVTRIEWEYIEQEDR